MINSVNDVNMLLGSIIIMGIMGWLFREAFRMMNEQTKRDSWMREVERQHRRRKVDAYLKDDAAA